MATSHSNWLLGDCPPALTIHEPEQVHGQAEVKGWTRTANVRLDQIRMRNCLVGKGRAGALNSRSHQELEGFSFGGSYFTAVPMGS